MLNFHHITIKDAMNHTFIEDFNYYLGNNDRLAIIGEEGNGKSTLLKAIYNQELIQDYATIQGTIDTDYKHIAYFEQQLSSDWFQSKVFEYLLKDEVEEEIPWEAYNNLENYDRLAVQLAIPLSLLHSEQEMGTLSGGERVKLRLLKLLGRAIDVLLLDEPTNDLDIETLEWLERFLLQQNIPIIFISHDETLLQNVATVILHMEQLNKKSASRYTIYRGKYEEYVKERSLKREHEVQVANKEKQEYIKKKIKLNDFMNAVHDAQNDTVRSPFHAAALKTKMKNLKAQERRFDAEGYHKVDSVEEAIDIYFNHEGLHEAKCIMHLQLAVLCIHKRILIRDIDLLVHGREKVVITGKNGCGKSLLMKAIRQELSKKESLRYGYMPQNYIDEFEIYDTPVAFLLEEGDQADITYSRQLLGRMKFTTDEMVHSIHALSEGQKAKLFLLRFIKWQCDVLLLDEPTRNLSPLSNPVIRGILDDYKGCIIAVSHDRKFIDQVCDRVYRVENETLLLSKNND